MFVDVAFERKLIATDSSQSKADLRDAIRKLVNGESEWQGLQAAVYGELIERAPPYPGARQFIVDVRQRGAHVSIVSHKTLFAAASPVGRNLREAARSWLFKNGFIGSDFVAEQDIYFESTRSEKLARICRLQVQIVIDDLIEVLLDPTFPADARRWLFSPGAPAGRIGAIERFGSWDEMNAAFVRHERA